MGLGGPPAQGVGRAQGSLPTVSMERGRAEGSSVDSPVSYAGVPK